MNFFAQVNQIKWKYVIGTNLAIVILAGVFATMQPATTATDNRSKAAEPVAPVVHQISVDAAHPPDLFTTDPNWAKVGDAILVRGQNLGKVPFGTLSLGSTEIPHENIVEWNPDYIVFTVPNGSTTGSVSIKVMTVTAKQLVLTSKNVIEVRKTNL